MTHNMIENDRRIKRFDGLERGLEKKCQILQGLLKLTMVNKLSQFGITRKQNAFQQLKYDFHLNYASASSTELMTFSDNNEEDKNELLIPIKLINQEKSLKQKKNFAKSPTMI